MSNASEFLKYCLTPVGPGRVINLAIICTSIYITIQFLLMISSVIASQNTPIYISIFFIVSIVIPILFLLGAHRWYKISIVLTSLLLFIYAIVGFTQMVAAYPIFFLEMTLYGVYIRNHLNKLKLH